uniref:Glutaredoxin domain-containing protein n=1 Tax=Ascaris lumbricoides TaxID=6252 RepID=A0A9J2Q0P0_ASCLU
MADFEDDEEIDAEYGPKPRAAYPSLRRILELYGWYIVLFTLLAVFLYKKYITPLIQSIAAKKELEERKKYDMDVRALNEEKIRAARERIQAQYEADAAREIERQRRREEEALEKAMREHGIDGNVASHRKSCGGGSSKKEFDGKSFVTNKINSIPVVVFSKSWCAFSRKAKQALSTFRLPSEFYEIIELDEIENGDSIQDALQCISGVRTVPRVFIGGQCIGGADETVEALRSGRLNSLLVEAGVIK